MGNLIGIDWNVKCNYDILGPMCKDGPCRNLIFGVMMQGKLSYVDEHYYIQEWYKKLLFGYSN